jgi:hypothetical protein
MNKTLTSLSGKTSVSKINSSNSYVFLLMVSLVSAFYPRILTAVGFPTIINFVHYGLLFMLFMVMVFQVQTRFSVKLLAGLFLLFGSMFISAIYNQAGLINVFLDFLILSQPIMFIYLANNKRWSEKHLKTFRFVLLSFTTINAVFAYIQYIILGLRTDAVKGVFLQMGAGHHIAGAIALSSCVYAIYRFKNQLLWYGFVIFQMMVTVFVDNKQSLVVFLISLLILTILNLHKFKKALFYLITLMIFVIVIRLLALTIFPQLFHWANIDKIQEGLEAKLAVFSIIHSFHSSFMNVLFGLGPGHTVGRLAQILPDYYSILSNLGATMSEITGYIWFIHETNWITNSRTGSSMWSLFFSWAGIWGDLGLVGVILYLFLWIFVYRKFCVDNYSKFLIITILVHGAVFQWMEEPAYMLFVSSLISLKFQEKLVLEYKVVPNYTNNDCSVAS